MSKRSIRKRRHRTNPFGVVRVTIGGIDITDSVKSISYTDYRERRRKVF